MQSSRPSAQDIQRIREAQNGSTEAFGSLYEQYAPSVYRFLYSHLSDRLDAEDLTEEVFFRVWRSLPTFQQQGVPFIAYVFRIARNALIDEYRTTKKTSQQVSLDQYGDITDSATSLGVESSLGFQRQEVRNLLAQLPEDYRMVLVLRFLNDLSPAETADVMGKTAGAVRVLQHRALAAFRKLVEPYL